MAAVTAVRVSCSGEASKRDKIKELCAYSIPATHDIFTDGELSQFSVLVGIPMYVHERPTCTCTHVEHLADPASLILSLICIIRPSMIVPRPPPRRIDQDYDRPKRARARPMYGYKEEDSYYPNLVAGAVMAGNVDGQERWTAQVGAVLLARVDKKPLETSHVHVLLGLLNEAAHTASTISVERALEMLTPTSFKTYYGKNVASLKELNAGEEWSDSAPWDCETARLLSEEDDEVL